MASDLHRQMFMLKKDRNRIWARVPPWMFLGAVAVLFPIFAFMTAENIHRYKENSIRLLTEKGSALIRSFEAGTLTGMLDMSWGRRQLQRLLTETAQQPDIAYLLVTDTRGNILAHSEPERLGGVHGKTPEAEIPKPSGEIGWRVVENPEGGRTFEVFRVFSPADRQTRRHDFRVMFYRCLRPRVRHKAVSPPTLLIFVGLDMRAVDEAGKADIRQSVLTGVILLFAGLAGMTLLFLAQGYRAARMSLSRIKAFSDHLVDNMPIGLFAVDSHRRIASFNHLAATLFGLSPEKVLERDAESMLPRELWELTETAEIRQGLVEREIECSVNEKKTICLEVSATRLCDENGTFLGHVILFKDISEVRSLRKEIARSQRLASVGSLAAGVAHEIRNPLSSIKGFATYFRERYKDIPDDRRIADIMIQETDRLNRVVSQLIELARPVSISLASVTMRTFLEDSLRLVERQAREKDIRIRSEISPEIEAAMIDGDKIRQVLLNLYLNALESMSQGGRLSLSLSASAGWMGIGVSDTGAGIPDKDLTRVFDPYFTTKSSGTGLGLAVVHNILEAHGGKIEIDSTLGKGSTVTVFLKYQQVENSYDPLPPD